MIYRDREAIVPDIWKIIVSDIDRKMLPGMIASTDRCYVNIDNKNFTTITVTKMWNKLLIDSLLSKYNSQIYFGTKGHIM